MPPPLTRAPRPRRPLPRGRGRQGHGDLLRHRQRACPPSTASGSATRSPPAARPATTTRRSAITARGAWECVKRHFRELGRRHPDRQAFTVAGIGDMSGDVFGNGMLRSPHIRLVAAFNHQHIFIDPAPDAGAQLQGARSGCSRCRARAGPTTTRRLLSAGGGIWARSEKIDPTAARGARAARHRRRGADAERGHQGDPQARRRPAVERRHRHLRQGERREPRRRSATAPTTRCASTAASCAARSSARAAISASRSSGASSTHSAAAGSTPTSSTTPPASTAPTSRSTSRSCWRSPSGAAG